MISYKLLFKKWHSFILIYIQEHLVYKYIFFELLNDFNGIDIKFTYLGIGNKINVCSLNTIHDLSDN